MLGWAYLKNSDDARNTPAEVYRDLMLKAGALVEVHDPYVQEYHNVPISHDLNKVLKSSNVIAVFAAHDSYMKLNSEQIKDLVGLDYPAIIDGRNIINPDEFINNGFIYKGIGIGDKNEHP